MFFMFVDLIFNIPLNKKFTYKVPQRFSHIKKGDRVKAPFGRRENTGIVLEVNEKFSGHFDVDDIKEITDLYSPYFRLDNVQFEIARRIWLYYLCSYGQALFTVAGAFKDVRIKRQEYSSAPENKLLLNSSQNDAINAFLNDGSRPYLLFGVTGSGKTEVYFNIIDNYIVQGKQAIFMLPEIALTPQIVKRFTDRFGNKLAVFNSKVSNGERNFAISAFRSGKIDLIVGTRSSVFLPAKDLGVIIIDEEHEYTYKQQDTPCYDAKVIANWRSNIENCRLLMGSATPTMESMKYARDGYYGFLKMENRAEKNRMPDVEVIDMGHIYKVSRNISKPLYESIKNTLDKKEQVILFHNRRGFSSFVLCEDCGEVIKCKNCDITLNYHKSTGKMVCHYCDFNQRLSKKCTSCGSDKIKYMGSGTQRAEEEIYELFPNARIMRVDKDSSSKKDFYWDFYKKMMNKEYDIVIGTQMIGKGFDFPHCTLVGVLWADFILDFPDFRSAERTAQLLTQVSGRSGRQKRGKVVIQTYSPDHYAIKTAQDHNYDFFYGEEIERRRMLSFPPFISLIRIVIKGKPGKRFLKNIDEIDKILREECEEYEVLGPCEAAIAHMKGMDRYHIIIKVGKNRKKIYEVLKKIKEKYKRLNLRIDVDPLDML